MCLIRVVSMGPAAAVGLGHYSGLPGIEIALMPTDWPSGGLCQGLAWLTACDTAVDYRVSVAGCHADVPTKTCH